MSVCTPHASLVLLEIKSEQIPLELGLWVVVNHSAGGGSQVLGRNNSFPSDSSLFIFPYLATKQFEITFPSCLVFLRAMLLQPALTLEGSVRSISLL